MFFAITFLAGFLLTAFFSPKPKIENAKASALSDFNFPRAQEGDPVPRWYGTNKYKGANTIWMGDFSTKKITKKVKTGVFSSKKQTIGYQYFVGLDLAICLGEGFVFKRIWAGKYELWNGCLFNDTCQNVIQIDRPELFGGKEKNGGFSGAIAMYCGNFDQVQDSYLASKIGPNVPAYNGVAHIVFRKCYFGNSANVEPIYIEGSMFTNSLGTKYGIMKNGLDANPVEVLYDIHVNDWGNLGIDVDRINIAQWRLAAKTVFDEGNGMSIIVANSNSGGEVCKQILKQINGNIFQNPTTGLFDLVLVRKNYVIGDLPVLGPHNVSSVNSFTKKLWSDTNNRVRVKFTDREQDYKENTVAQADDFANIRFQKKINPAEFSFPTVFDGDLANELAARELANLNVPLYQTELTVDRTNPELAPGSVFVFNWPEYNIENMVVRVRKMGMGTYADGKITYGVVQDEFASDAVVVGKPTTGNGPLPNYQPQPIQQINFELPYWLRSISGFPIEVGTPHFAFVAASPSPYSIGYNFVVGTPEAPDEDEEVEPLTGETYNAWATLVTAIGRFDGFDGTIDEVVIGTVSDTDVLNTAATDTAMRAGSGMFYLNGELMSFRTAEDNDDGTWTLAEVNRALVDTGWIGGATGDRLYFIRDQVGFLPDPGAYSGQLQDVTGTGAFPLETAPVVALAGTGRADRPYAPDGVTIEGDRSLARLAVAGSAVTIAWLERNRLTDPAKLKFETDPTEAAEAGTAYIVEVVTEDNEVAFTSAPVAGAMYELELTNAMAGRSVVQVWAKRDAVLSYAASPIPLTVYLANSLLIDGELLTIDGESIEL